MISQENTDERFTETSSSSYDTDTETTLTVTLKKRSTGKKKSNNICIPAFQSRKRILVCEKVFCISIFLHFQMKYDMFLNELLVYASLRLNH